MGVAVAGLSLGDVAKLTAMNETIVSANNKFLVATGVVKGPISQGTLYFARGISRIAMS